MLSIMSMLSIFRRKSEKNKGKKGTLRRRRGAKEKIRVKLLPYIPQNIMEEIFHKLPYNSMAICKVVCKSWNSIISSPNFINDHYNRLRLQGNNTRLVSLEYAYLDKSKCNLHILCYSDLVDNRSLSSIVNKANLLEDCKSRGWWVYEPRLIGSYNGLVAISCDNRLILWNPLTNKHSFVKVDFYDDIDGSRVLYGLCYDNFKDEYSVVVGSDYQSPPVTPSNFNDDDITYERMDVYVYHFKDGSCKELNQNSLDRRLLDKKVYKGEIGKVIHGIPHWVVQFYDFEDPFVKTEILYFDSREEVFKEMDRPGCCVEKKLLGIAAVNGENELGCVVDDGVSSCFEIWVMKEYGNVESWTNLYTFSYINLIDNFGCIKYLDVMGFMPNNGELLIYLNDEYSKLLVYDVYKGNCRVIKSLEYGVAFELVTFEPKLISPPCSLQKSEEETPIEIEESEDGDDDNSYY